MSYHIIIQSEEDGTLLDQEVEGFLLVRKLGQGEDNNDPPTLLHVRGMNSYEAVGMLQWAQNTVLEPTFPRSAAWVRRNPVRVLPI